MTPGAFASTAPIHPFIVASDRRVRDRASLVGRVNIACKRPTMPLLAIAKLEHLGVVQGAQEKPAEGRQRDQRCKGGL
jgi:hypothetical protein